MDGRQIRQSVLVATGEQLREPYYYRRLWKTAKSLAHLSSRDWLREIEYLFRDTDIFKIELRYPGGELYPIPYMFDLFGEDDEDARRWISLFLKADESGENPKHISIKLERLRAIDLFLRATVARYSDVTWEPEIIQQPDKNS